MKDKYVIPNKLFVKNLNGESIPLDIDPDKIEVEDIKEKILIKEGIPIDQQRFIFSGLQFEDGYTLRDYMVPNNSTFNLVIRLRGIGFEQPDQSSSYQVRSFVDRNNSDLISIVSVQSIEGCWSKIPEELLNENRNLNDLLQKVTNWSVQKDLGELKNYVVATVACLIFLVQFKKENFEMWKLIYAKGIEWLKSIEGSIDWDKLNHYK